MSEFSTPVVTVGPVEKHPNADSLGITQVFGYPVIVRLGETTPGMKAVYVPVDAVVPDIPQFKFLDGHFRIKAKKLRGTLSLGMLMPLKDFPEVPQDASDGTDLSTVLGIGKYEQPVDYQSPLFRGDCEKDPGVVPGYTDIQNYRRYPNIIPPWEPVVITEKLHGTNARFFYGNPQFQGDTTVSGGEGARLYCGSHKTWKKPGETLWWEVAKEYGLEEKLKGTPYALFGEIFGYVQDLRYGASPGQRSLRIFDVYHYQKGVYLDFEEAHKLIEGMKLQWVPVLYRGTMKAEGYLAHEANAESSITGADHHREGLVIRTAVERFHPEVGRVVLKYVGERYLLRKGGTEHH
jgi:RNA ligase (TIGR02306 family)